MSQFLKSASTEGVQQYEQLPAFVDASTPIINLSPDTPLKSEIGFIQSIIPLQFRQFRYTSLRQLSEPGGKSYQLLQAWGWYKLIASSANLMMLTIQLKGCPAQSGLQSLYPWYTVTHSGETIIILVIPIAFLKPTIMLAIVRGVDSQLSISRSTPSNQNLLIMSLTESMKFLVLAWEERMAFQLPFCPPTDMRTFLFWFFHVLQGLLGK